MFEYAISAGEGTLLQHGVCALSIIDEKIKALGQLGQTEFSVTVAPYNPNYILGVPHVKKHDSSGQAGTENEIEITPEMIERGMKALRSEDPEDVGLRCLFKQALVATFAPSRSIKFSND